MDYNALPIPKLSAQRTATLQVAPEHQQSPGLPGTPAGTPPPPSNNFSHFPLPTPEIDTYLPDGTPLLLSPMVELVMGILFGDKDLQQLAYPAVPLQHIVLLYLASEAAIAARDPHHALPSWQRVCIPDDGSEPYELWHRPDKLIPATQQWLTLCFPNATLHSLALCAINLWNREHAGEVVPDPTADRGPVAQKKNPPKATPTKSTSSPASPAGGTGRASRTSSTARPSATSSPRATATSPRSASPASPPPPSPPASRKPKPASKKR